MKKTILGMIIGVVLTVVIGAGVENYQVRKNTAEVSKKLGLYVFTDSDPVSEYEVLGTVKISAMSSLSDEYGARRDALLKKAKKEYPNAEAILCYPETTGLSSVSADVIIFK